MKSTARIGSLGMILFLAGALILIWVASEAFERQATQRESLAVLDAEADSLAAIEAAAEAQAESPAALEGATPAPQPPRSRPGRGSVVARIAAPSLGVDVVAHEGVDRATLKLGAGHFPSTALPGEPGNSAFAAHRDVDFRALRKAAPGHDIYVDTGEATFVYRVSGTSVVDPADVHVLDDRGATELTLVTCYPFDWVGPAPRRFVVRAQLRGRFEVEDRILEDALGSIGGRE